MVTDSISILSASRREQLTAIQSTAKTIDRVQLRLSSGLEVNGAIDSPDNFFTSRGLSNRAQDLNRRLDAIRQSLRAIQVADDGAQSAIEVVDLAEAYLTDIEERISSGEITFGSAPSDAVPGNVTQIRPSGPGDFAGYAGSQDGVGVVNVSNGGEDFSLTGNLWKKIAINYDVTADTVLEFQFRSTEIPEIAAIGFDNDDNFSNSNDQFFLYGTQFGGIPYSAPVATYQYDGSGDFVSVEIPIGTFFTGTFSHITFINDDDSVSTGESEYRDVFLREGPTEAVPDTSVEPEELQRDYEIILNQLDELVQDANYRGIGLLNSEDLTTIFNEDGSSFLLSEGINATSSGLGLNRAGFSSAEAVQEKIEEVKKAKDVLRAYAGTLALDFSIIKTRANFTQEMVSTLESGGDDLIIDDQNQSGAEFLALQTRQQLQFATLAAREASIVDLI